MTTRNKLIAAIGVGKNNAMKIPALEKNIGGTDRGTNNDTTRGLIKDAISNDVPIGSNSHYGVWLIDSDAECDEVCDRIDRTIQTFQQKRDAIRRGWQRRKASKAAGSPWPK